MLRFFSPPATLSPPRVIICDFGNVLVDITPPDQAPLSKRCSVSPEEVKAFFFESDEFHEYERGRMSRTRFVQVIREKLGYGGDDRQFREDFCNIFTLNEKMYDLILGELKVHNDVEIWLLSNINEWHYEYVYKRWPGIFSGCRRVFVSCELGLRKADPKTPHVWETILRMGGAKGYECLLLDDSRENGWDASRQAQIPFIVVEGVASKLRQQLEGFGLRFPKENPGVS